MKRLLITALLALGLAAGTRAEIIQPSDRPNRTQQLMQQRGYGMFIHFGVNTFDEKEWSDGTIPASRYNPTHLDCDQWVRVARDAGFRYVLLVTKHHDGFCLWDSKLTDYDVASSPVKTDVVGAVAAACRKYGLGLAFYYSLWDRHEPCYRDKDFGKYIDYMCGQLTELLTQYGDVCEVWLDGGWDRKPADWQLDRVYRLIKKHQPYCAVSVNHTIETQPGSRKFAHPDDMTEDNKFYFQYFPCDFRLWDPKIAHPDDKKQYLHEGKSYYVPFEHTLCISKRWSWFAKKQMEPARDLDELEELFYRCTAGGNTLVVNLPPDQTGRIREHEANTVIALRQRLGLEYGKPLPTGGTTLSKGADVTASSTFSPEHDAAKAVDGGMETRWASRDTLPTLTVDLGAPKTFNRIAIFEYMDTRDSGNGFTNYRTNRIRQYTVDVQQDGEWRTVYYGDAPMGDCKSIRLPQSVTARQVRLRVLEATAPPSVYEFNVIDGATADPLLPHPSTLPSDDQRAQIARKYGMFIHFGINTFHNEEWTDGSKPASSYAPERIDAEQWVKAAKAAGMKYVILTAKHHDGFCLWDSRYTDYDVASSPNPANVVEEVAKACRKHGVGLGLYYSLWDRKVNANVEDVAADSAYNDYMLHQLDELMDITRPYGPLVEFWFDGGWVKPNDRWPVEDIYRTIKRREPHCQVGVNWTIGHPDNDDKHPVLPADQRAGYPIRYFPSDFRLGDPYLPADNDPKVFVHDGRTYYMPWESTVCLSKRWFYHTDDHEYKSVEELAKLYRQATKNDNILILNCPPGRDGRLRKADIKLLKSLRQALNL